MTASASLDEIRTAIDLLIAPSSVIELRALGRSTMSGYFRDIRRLLAAAEGLCQRSDVNIYVTLNPVAEALLARAPHKLVIRPQHTTGDQDVVRRRWLPVDLDPVRPAGVSATAAEKDAAVARSREVMAWLSGQGWPQPVVADSGNGVHLLYRIDLPADDRGLVRRCLQAIGLRFSDERVTVDTAVGNPARIWRLYGTVTRKGADTAERPHRRSRLLAVPSELVVVSEAMLNALAGAVPVAPARAAGAGWVDVDEWLRRHELSVVASSPWEGGRKWVLNPCPFNAEHTDRSAFIVQFASGTVVAGCHHQSCTGNDWGKLRRMYEAGDEPVVQQPAVRQQQPATPILRRAATIAPRTVAWLWPGYVPLGAITVLDGDPGLGKSLVALDLAARVSRGAAMPDRSEGCSGQVLLLSAEDDAAATSVPRLRAAGANLERVFFLDGQVGADGERWPVLLSDADVLAAAAERLKELRLIVIDPLMAFVPSDVDTHNDASVRRMMRRLAELAAERELAVLLVRHLNKREQGTPALYRGGGSIAIIAQCRSGLLVCRDPDDDSGRRRLLQPTKSNLAPPPAPLSYVIIAAPQAVPPAPQLAWAPARPEYDERPALYNYRR